MKLLGDTKNRSAKDEIGKNVPQLESTDIELWFTDKNYEPLDTKDKINIIVVIN